MAENNDNGHKNGAGRPKLDLDPVLIQELAGIGCTMIEIASICHCSVDTLENNFSDAVKKGRQEIRESLRRRQLDVALNGSRKGEHANPTMLIWLGKQMLDQKDKQELTGPGGGPLQHEHRQFDWAKLSIDELAEVERLIQSAIVSEVKGENSGKA